MIKKVSSTGDTIIEVVLAMALLTSILFIAWSITNRATQMSLAATERTKMVNAVKQQAEIAKALWAKPGNQTVFKNDVLYPLATTAIKPNPCDEPLGDSKMWHFLVDSSNNITSDTSVLTLSDTEKVWIQRSNDTATPATFTDLYVRACWTNNSGRYQKTENTQVIVRLNL